MNAKENLLEREKEIIRLLGLLLDKSLDFIVVGGYAIATYKKKICQNLKSCVKKKNTLRVIIKRYLCCMERSSNAMQKRLKGLKLT